MRTSLTSLCIAMVFFISGVCSAQELAEGTTRPAAEPQLPYIKTVRDYVNNHWTYKKTSDNQSNIVEVELLLDKNGYLLEMKMLTLSPDDDFNESALKAIAEMEPFPPIPDYLEEDKLGVRCHLEPNS